MIRTTRQNIHSFLYGAASLLTVEVSLLRVKKNLKTLLHCLVSYQVVSSHAYNVFMNSEFYQQQPKEGEGELGRGEIRVCIIGCQIT